MSCNKRGNSMFQETKGIIITDMSGLKEEMNKSRMSKKYPAMYKKLKKSINEIDKDPIFLALCKNTNT